MRKLVAILLLSVLSSCSYLSSGEVRKQHNESCRVSAGEDVLTANPKIDPDLYGRYLEYVCPSLAGG